MRAMTVVWLALPARTLVSAYACSLHPPNDSLQQAKLTDGREFSASIVGSGLSTDIAVILPISGAGVAGGADRRLVQAPRRIGLKTRWVNRLASTV